MNRQFGEAHFTSCKIENPVAGYVGFEMTRRQYGNEQQVARILFWDACGQFSIETFGTDVPLEMLEELIAEAREAIQTA